jgi:hypothetical protein
MKVIENSVVSDNSIDNSCKRLAPLDMTCLEKTVQLQHPTDKKTRTVY